MHPRSRQIIVAALLSLFLVIAFAVLWKVGADAVSTLQWRHRVRQALDQRPTPELTPNQAAMTFLAALSQLGTDQEEDALAAMYAFLTEDRQESIPDPAALKEDLSQPAFQALLASERTLMLDAIPIEDRHAMLGVIAEPTHNGRRGTYRILLARGRKGPDGGSWRLAAILPDAAAPVPAQAPADHP